MLKIDSIYLKNFGNIIEETVNFTNPFTVFSGENGQGKSTFLKGIYLNIFDEYEGTYADYVRWGQNGFENKMKFQLFGKSCESEVVVVKGSATRKLTIDNDQYEGSNAKQVLAELLPPKITMAACVARENQIDVIQTSPAQRREFLKNLYDLNFKDEIDSLKAGYDDNNESLKSAEQEVSALENKEYVYPEKPEVSLSEAEVKVLEEKRDLFQTKISEYESKKEAYDSKVETFETLKKSIKLIEDSYDTTSDRKDTISDSIEANQTVIDGEFDPEPSLTMYDKKNIELTQKLDDLLAAPIKGPQRKARKLSTAKKESLISEISKVEAFQESLEDKLLLMKTGKCSECGAPYSAEDTSDTEDQVKGCKVKLRDLKGALADENASLKKNEGTLRDQDDLMNKVGIYDSKVKHCRENIEENKKSREARKEELKKSYDKDVVFAKTNLSLMETSLKEASEKLDDLTSQKENIQKNIQDNFAVIELPEELDENIETDLQFCIDGLEVHSNILESIRTVSTVIENLDKQKELDVKELEKKRKVRDKYQKEVSEYDEAMTILKTGLPQFILVKLTKALEDLSNFFLENTYDGRYKLQFIPSKTSLKLVYGAKETSVKLSSGYEQQVFSTAFKVALSNSGVDTRILMLDEVDSASSEDNSEKLFQFLGSLMGKFFDQYIIVTHKPKIKELLENEFKADIILVEDGKIRIN